MEQIVSIILGVIFCFCIFIGIGHGVYLDEILVWRVLMKNKEHIRFKDTKYGVSYYSIYADDDEIGEIVLRDEDYFILRDHINYNIVLKPTPFFFTCQEIKKYLYSINPQLKDGKQIEMKKSVVDYFKN